MNKKAKIKQKAQSLKNKLKEKLKGRPSAKAAATATILAAFAIALAGCQSADPASRSNRTTYGDIIVRDSSDVVLSIGDGLLASADGGGDTQSNTPTNSPDVKPELAVGIGGGSAGTGSSAPQGGLAADALSKLLAIVNGGGRLTADEAAAIRDCVDGNCEP